MLFVGKRLMFQSQLTEVFNKQLGRLAPHSQPPGLVETQNWSQSVEQKSGTLNSGSQEARAVASGAGPDPNKLTLPIWGAVSRISSRTALLSLVRGTPSAGSAATIALSCEFGANAVMFCDMHA